MFQINDVISYGAQGVYKITAIERKAVGKEKKDYYVLTPVNEKDPLVFAPVDNPFVQKKMRRLLTPEEVHGLIDSMGGECALWKMRTSARSAIKASSPGATMWS